MSYNNMQALIDGERFEVHKVNQTIREKAMPYAKVLLKHRPGTFSDFPDTMFSSLSQECDIGRISEKAPPGMGRTVAHTTQSGDFGWRPLLIPDKPLNQSMCPNGYLTTGGTLYMDDEPVRIGLDEHVVFCNGRIRIGDTVFGKELSWMYVDGKLLCAQVLITSISEIDLSKQRIL